MPEFSHASHVLALGNNATLLQLAQKLEAQHIKLYCFNPLTIVPIDWQKKTIIPWQKLDKAIVISVPAALYGLNPMIAILPEKTNFFAIGPSSAAQIDSKKSIFLPSRYNSEALLDLPALQDVQQQNIALFKGKGGRTLLTQTLQKRGGILYTIDCYERRPIITDLTKALRFWQTHHINQIILSSLGSLDAFLAQIPKAGKNWLQQLTWIVTSARLEQALWQYGFTQIKRAEHFSVSALQAIILP